MGDIKTLEGLLEQVDYLNCKTGDVTAITGLQDSNGVPYIYKIEVKVRRTLLEEQDMDGKVDRALPPTMNKIEGKLVFIKDISKLNTFKAIWDAWKAGVDQMLKDKETEVGG